MDPLSEGDWVDACDMSGGPDEVGVPVPGLLDPDPLDTEITQWWRWHWGMAKPYA